MPGPGLQQRPATTEPIGKMADRQSVSLRRIVFHDHAEIVQHQETRALVAGRYQQIGAVGPAWEWLATDALEALSRPIAERELVRAVGEQIVEALRNDDLVSPGRAGDPTVLLQVVCRRGEQVGE